MADARQELLVNFSRDLCVCTEDEMRSRWDGDTRRAIDIILAESEQSYEGLVKDHNPAYFLAQNLFFDTVLDIPHFLYAPYHRDTLCKNAVEYYLGDHNDAGFLFLGPRDTYKSTFLHGAVPIWVVLREYVLHNRFGRVALLHHKDDIALRNNRRIRSKLAHHWMFNPAIAKRLGRVPWFPEWHTTESKLGSAKEISIPCAPKGEAAEANFEAAGLGGSLTGSHYMAIFFSDLVTEDHRFSATLRQETQEKYGSMKYLLDTVGGKRFHDGTIYHRHDLWNAMLDSKWADGSPLYRCVVKPAGYNEAKLLAAEGKPYEHVLAHPHKWSLEHMERDRQEFLIRDGNDEFFQCQIELKIVSERSIVTSWDDIRVVEPEDIPRNAINAVLIDPAWKGTENSGKGDYASIQVWSFQRRGDMIIRTLRDGVHSNELSQSDGLAEIFRLGARYGCIFAVPEETGGSGFSKTLEDARSKYGHWFQIVRLRDTFSRAPGKKAARIVNFIGESQDGQIEISTECSGALRAALMDEYTNFTGPGSLKHDDAIDCASFTCDSGVREEITPARGVADRGTDSNLPYWMREKAKTGPPLTRYCGV